MDPILFASLPSSASGTPSLSFHSLATHSLASTLKPQPGSSYTSSTPSPLPPRKTTAIHFGDEHTPSLVVSICGKDGRNGVSAWGSLFKATPTTRLIPVGRPVVLALSTLGHWLAVGTQDGRVLIWDLGSGIMLASWDAHYRSVTCLQFSLDDTVLVSASEDGQAAVWVAADVMEAICNPLAPATPMVALSDHTLPITDIFITPSVFPDNRIFTASIDGTVKVWCISNPEKPLLATFELPGPAHHIAVDILERFFYVSCATSAPIATSSKQPAPQNSQILHVPLFLRQPESHTGGVSVLESGRPIELPHHGQHKSSSGAGNPSYVIPSGVRATALHIAPTALLVGLSNGRIVHLSLPTLVPLRTTIPNVSVNGAKEVTDDPVVVLASTMNRPLDLIKTVDTSSTRSKSTMFLSHPLAALGRTPGRTSDPTFQIPQLSSTTTTLDSQQQYFEDLSHRVVVMKLPSWSREEIKEFSTFFPQWDDRTTNRSGNFDFDQLMNVNGDDDEEEEELLDWTEDVNESSRQQQQHKESDDQVEKLRRELQVTKFQLDEALNLNDGMWKIVVENSLLRTETTTLNGSEMNQKKRKM